MKSKRLATEALRRAVLTLWQTSLLRRTKLTVLDEIENGISYHGSTFLRELPRLYAALEDTLAALDPTWNETEVPSFLRMGSWIGGDRDGNPFVTVDVLRQALRQQSARALSFYLEELHELGGELSLSSLNVKVSEPLQALADRSPDRSTHRQDEPYRRAISGIYARLAATAQALHQPGLLRHAVGEAPPFADAGELRAELDVLDRSLRDNGSAILARGRLRGLRRAVDVFGFHLASLDLRQNSDVHERTVGELLEAACPGTGYAGLAEPARNRQAVGGACDGAAAGFPVPGLFGGDGVRSWRFSEARPRHAGCTAQQRWPTASSPRPTASRTCLRRRSCSRRSGCCGRRKARSI